MIIKRIKEKIQNFVMLSPTLLWIRLQLFQFPFEEFRSTRSRFPADPSTTMHTSTHSTSDFDWNSGRIRLDKFLEIPFAIP